MPSKEAVVTVAVEDVEARQVAVAKPPRESEGAERRSGIDVMDLIPCFLTGNVRAEDGDRVASPDQLVGEVMHLEPHADLARPR